MTRLQRILLIGLAACIAIVLIDVAAVYAVAFMISRVGLRPLAYVTQPRDAITVLRGRRQIDWHGLRIRVDSQFVLELESDVVYARPLQSGLFLLAPGVGFVDHKDSTRKSFAQQLEWCSGASDRCSVRRPVPASGQGVCLQYRGTSTKVWSGDIEVRRCRLPSGIEARYACSLAVCPKFQKVVDDAFATAPPLLDSAGQSAKVPTPP
jgi:hypothetical protein